MINTLAIIFVPILIGYLLVKFNYIDSKIGKDIKLFVIRVAAPCRIFLSMLNLNMETLKQIIPLTISFIILTTLLILSSYFLLRIKDLKTKAAYMLAITFGNYGFIGWAVLDSAFGQDGLSRGIFFTTLWWPVIYLGTFFIGKLLKLNSQLDIKSYRVNMITPILVLIVGVLFNLLKLNIYTPLLKSIENFGNMTVPLILFTVGLNISFSNSYKNIKQTIVPVILRPAFGLIIAYLTILIMGIKDPISTKVVLIESTMPVAVMTVILGDMLNLDEKLTSSILILSTILSLITIPLSVIIFG